MLTNLFSIFDPTIYSFNPFIIIFLVVLLLCSSKSKKLYINSNYSMFISNFFRNLNNEFLGQTNSILNKKVNIKNKGNIHTIVVLFLFIFYINFLSLFPFIFSNTSHISINATLSVTLWITSVVVATISRVKSFLAHLTPIGTPIALISFIVIIETVRNLIRPITLAVRLIANLVAGHLLLRLLSKFSILTVTNSLISSIFFIILGRLEIGVSLIQAYVITLLFILYLKEAF